DGIDFLVMEYLKGETLAARLRHGPLPLDEALWIAIQISDAVEAAHAEGVVHSDLKPANVMRLNGGASGQDVPHSKLPDFGLARFQRAPVVSESGMRGADFPGMNRSSAIAGTLHYMAPEQVRGEEADPRSDIFSLGCVMYEMVSGRAPFAGRSAHDVVSAILGPDPPQLTFTEPGLSADTADASRRFERVIRRCLEKTPERRFARIRDVKTELEEIARAAPPARRRVSRQRWIAAIAGVLTIATIIAWELRPREGQSPLSPQAGMKVVQLTALNGLEIAPTFSPDGT